jgi:hypothetical protein
MVALQLSYESLAAGNPFLIVMLYFPASAMEHPKEFKIFLSLLESVGNRNILCNNYWGY